MAAKRRLTLIEEREMIEGFHQLLLDVQGTYTPGEWDEQFGARYGVAQLDQLHAAAADAERLVVGAYERATALGYTAATGVDIEAVRFKAMVMAAVVRCAAASACVHVTGGGHRLFCFVAARVITCERCQPRYRGALAAHHQRMLARLDTVCDACLTENEGGQFQSMVVPWGPAVVALEVCEACMALARGEAAP